MRKMKKHRIICAVRTRKGKERGRHEGGSRRAMEKERESKHSEREVVGAYHELLDCKLEVEAQLSNSESLARVEELLKKRISEYGRNVLVDRNTITVEGYASLKDRRDGDEFEHEHRKIVSEIRQIDSKAEVETRWQYLHDWDEVFRTCEGDEQEAEEGEEEGLRA